MRALLLLVGLLLQLHAHSTTARRDDPRPINRSAQVAYEKLNARDFAYLERQVTELRRSPRLLSDGQPELAAFYAGVSKCVQMRCGDEDLSPEAWSHHSLLLDEWNKAYPHSSAAKIARANFMREFAWYARGLGYSNTVSDAQYKLFAQRTQTAHAMFEEIRKSSADDPAWIAGLLAIALVERWSSDRFNALHDEGVRRFPYYMPIYFLKGAYLSPRWGGTHSSFTKYVNETVQATSSTMGESMYARLNWSSWSPDMFQSGQSDWPRMREGFLRITRDFPDQWNINHFAKFACMAGDADTLRSQIGKITPTPIREAWGDMQFFDRCKELAR